MKVLLAGLLVGLSCGKKPTDYRAFSGGSEIVYPGVIGNPMVLPGNDRLLLEWHPSSDPSVARYVVYWNNYADSVIVEAVGHNPLDTVKCYINNLSEYSYTFFVSSYDSNGNKSVLTEIDNARVYGSIYQNVLHNRLPDSGTPFVVNSDGSVTLYFAVPDTINITTKIQYTNASGIASVKSIPPDSNSVTLPGYLAGAPVLYQSSYIPVRGAIDTFYTVKADTFPPIFKLVQCDKSLFAEMTLPADMGLYESDTRVSRLWDGSVGPQDFPNVFHSDGANALPQTLSFDMGKVYKNLGVIEETGRTCCNNPSDFEVWGIADTTGAIPTLASNDPGWKAQSIAKGWTELTEATRSDDGSAAMKFNFIPNPPPIRFIRIRVLADANGEMHYVNIAELTFWDKE
jgi:hypothetical protein